jgi:hypothetical protein
MVEEQHAAIGKTAGPASANGAMRMLRAVWNHALDRDGSLPANPVRRLKRGWFPMPPRPGWCGRTSWRHGTPPSTRYRTGPHPTT